MQHLSACTNEHVVSSGAVKNEGGMIFIEFFLCSSVHLFFF